MSYFLLGMRPRGLRRRGGAGGDCTLGRFDWFLGSGGKGTLVVVSEVGDVGVVGIGVGMGIVDGT